MVKVLNPKTGRMITKGGPTWQKLYGKKKTKRKLKRRASRLPVRRKKRKSLPDPLLFPGFYDPLWWHSSRRVAVKVQPAAPEKPKEPPAGAPEEEVVARAPKFKRKIGGKKR